MNKKETENHLISAAKIAMQKVQQLINADNESYQLDSFLDERLGIDVVTHNDLIKAGEEPSDRLNDKINSRQNMLDDLSAEIDSNNTELDAAISNFKQCIAKLRRVNPKAANELENALGLKMRNRGSSKIKKKP